MLLISNNPESVGKGGGGLNWNIKQKEWWNLHGLGYVKREETLKCHGQNKKIIRDDETDCGQSTVHFF